MFACEMHSTRHGPTHRDASEHSAFASKHASAASTSTGSLHSQKATPATNASVSTGHSDTTMSPRPCHPAEGQQCAPRKTWPRTPRSSHTRRRAQQGSSRCPGGPWSLTHTAARAQNLIGPSENMGPAAAAATAASSLAALRSRSACAIARCCFCIIFAWASCAEQDFDTCRPD